MKLSHAFVLSFFLIGMAFLGQAQEAQGPSNEKFQALKAACESDVTKLCSSSSQGKGPVDCLKSNLDQLSSECKTLISQMPERPNKQGEGKGQGQSNSKMEALKTNCSSDVEKLCADSQSQRGGPISCLKKNLEQLSSACKTSVSEIPEHSAQSGSSSSGAGRMMEL